MRISDWSSDVCSSDLEFTHSIFQKVNFSHSHLSNVKFIRSTFKDVNFSNVSMYGTWSFCSFNKVDFTDADLESASFPKAKMIDVNFSDAKLKNADLSRVNVENVSFDNADLSYAVLIGSNITEEQLSKTKTYKCATLPNGDVYTNKDRKS